MATFLKRWLWRCTTTSRASLQQAEAIYRQILQVDPSHADALHLLGVIAHQVGQHDLAIRYISQAISQQSDNADFHSNLGNALHARGRLAEAVDRYQEAIRLKPDFAEAHHNLGVALEGQTQLQEAMVEYQEAIRLKPNYVEPHINLSELLLLHGNFEQGWPEYQWRWQQDEFARLKRSFSQPRWDGSALAGRTILLLQEGGFGDVLLFIRYAPLVKERGGRVLVVCFDSLIPLLAHCPGIDVLLPASSPLPAFEVYISMMDLPFVFRTTLATIPACVPYLSPDSGLVERWHQELGGAWRVARDAAQGDVSFTTHHAPRTTPFKIGIAWQANPQVGTEDRREQASRTRTVPLTRFAPLAKLEGVRLYSLQKGAGTEQLREVESFWPIVDLGSRFQDFADTAAAIANLDLVVTMDTAIAHCAGGLGVPVWVALWSPPTGAGCWSVRTARGIRRCGCSSRGGRATGKTFLIGLRKQ